MTIKEVALKAARNAGKILKENIGNSINIQTKNDFDYVTEIDKKCEEQIINLIKEHFPDHSILAEESGYSDKKSDNLWIIDPLDGTTNFIHNTPHCAVSIAFERKKEIILGVIYDPFRDELFYAEKEKGAYCNNKQIYTSNQHDISHCLVATGFPFRNRDILTKYLNVFAEIFLQVSGIRRTGSAALDLAYVACGRYDGFWELKLCPWDVAAGSIILKEAGGIITDFEKKGDHVRTGNVIASNEHIHDVIYSKIQKIFPENP